MQSINSKGSSQPAHEVQADLCLCYDRHDCLSFCHWVKHISQGATWICSRMFLVFKVDVFLSMVSSRLLARLLSIGSFYKAFNQCCLL